MCTSSSARLHPDRSLPARLGTGVRGYGGTGVRGGGGEGVRMRMEKKGREVGRKVGHTKGEVNRGVWAIFKMVNRILT